MMFCVIASAIIANSSFFINFTLYVSGITFITLPHPVEHYT